MGVQILKQSTSTTVKLGPFVDSTDGDSEETGLTINAADILLSKNGAAYAAKNDATAASHDDGGEYDVDLDATDTGTLGRLRMKAHPTGALYAWRDFLIVPAVVYDALVSDSDYLTVDMIQIEGIDATDQIRDAIVDDATKIDGSAVNTLAGHDPGSVIAAASDVSGLNDLSTTDVRNAVIADGDGTEINAADLNTLSGHDPGATLGTADAGDAMTLEDSAITSAKFAAGALTAAAIASNAIGSDELATTAINAIRDAILSDSTAFNGADVAAILADVTGINGDAMRGTDDAALASKLEAYIQLLARSDAAIATDRAAELSEINADEGSGAGNYDNEANSVEGIRDRGDAAWITATGFSTHGDPDPSGYIDAAISSRSDFDEATDQVTVATNNDKTGYSLSTAGIQAIWDALTAVLTTAGSIGKLLVDNINATISSRSSHDDPDPSGHIDAAISSRSSHSANDVTGGTTVADAETNIRGADSDTLETLSDQLDATALEATLTAMKGAGWTNETLKAIKDAVDAIGGDATAANQTTIINHLTDVKGATWSDETLVALNALLDALPTASEIDTELTNSHGAGTWGGAAGSGAREIIFTVSDGSGTLASGLSASVKDSLGNTVAGPLSTSSQGKVTFYLDDDSDYEFVTPSTAHWQGNSTTFDVSGDSSESITLTAQTLPTPSAADKYIIILNAADEYGDPVGADAWTVKITDVRPRGLDNANLVQLSEENGISIDGDGQGSFEVSKETQRFTISITPTMADGTTGDEKIFTVNIDSDDANDSDQIYMSDLLLY